MRSSTDTRTRVGARCVAEAVIAAVRFDDTELTGDVPWHLFT
jgi:hypothetical protein